MSEKLVSVIVPFYNRIPWCLEAIESVQRQTYSNWELILINDGSTEDISSISRLVRTDPRIQLIEQENRGVAAARNTGISAAKGYYIALLDSDDLWDPEKLEKQITYMEEKGYQVSHTSYTIFNSEGTVRKVNTGRMEGDVLRALIKSCPLCTPSAVFEKALADNIHPPFREEFQYGEDACFWISLAKQAKIGAVQEPLTFVRHTDTTASNSMEKVQIALMNIRSYVQSDPDLSGFQAEIRHLSKGLEEIEIEAERRKKEDLERKSRRESLEPIRSAVKEKFEGAGFYPKVSIVIPVYNGANYMRDAIDSALEQTYGNIEVVVVNDGSRDNGKTDAIARSYGSAIRYFEKANGGVATALNLGIEKMAGEYFSWLSHDDMYAPTKIEEEVQRLLLESDRTAIVAEGYQVVNSLGEYQYTVNLHDSYEADRLKSSLFLLLRGGINGCALLIHKSHFERVGLFDPALPTTQDYDLWFRMFRGQTVYYMKSSNVLSRSHEEQGSKALLSEHVKECDSLWINMMNSLTLEEKKQVSDSEYDFYLETWNFLKSVTGYQGAILHAECETFRTAIDEFERTQNDSIIKVICEISGYQEQELRNSILPLRNQKKRNSRILFYLIDRDDLGGLNRIVLQVAGLLSKQYDVIVTSISEVPSKKGYPTPAGVTEVKIPWAPWVPEHNGAYKLSYLSYLLHVDIIVNSYNCVESQLKVYEAAQHFDIHTIAWNHEFYFLPYWKSSLYDCLTCRNSSLKKADVVVWLNSFSAQVYHAFGENGIVLPNPNPFAGKERTVKELPENLLAIGRFNDSIKGLEDLLRMFRKVLDNRPDSTLSIVGSCNLNEPLPSNSKKTYGQLIEELKLPERALRLVGEVTDVEAYYQKACIHILPSKYEGFGLTILEAGTMGLPSVVYGGSGMDDIITDGVDGCIVSPGSWDALADAVLELLDNPKMRTSMSVAAQEMAARYDPEKVADMWCDMIDSVLGKSHEECIEYLSARYSYHPYEDPNMFAALVSQEYEKCISSLLNSEAFTSWQNAQKKLPAAELQWQEECERLQQSFSWRITKPLRLGKKAFVILKTEGLCSFLKKVLKKLFH